MGHQGEAFASLNAQTRAVTSKDGLAAVTSLCHQSDFAIVVIIFFAKSSI